MKNIKISAVIFIIAVITVIFTACGDGGQNTDGPGGIEPNGANESNGITVEDTPEEPAEISDDLPEADFEGYDFRIISYSGIRDRVFVEDDIGEVINDAQYYARTAVEERFNVKISLLEDGASTDGSNLNSVRNSILAGDDAFDLIHAHDITLCTNSLDNIFVNLYGVPHLDFEKPWWPKHSVDSLTVLDQMYVFSNAMTTDSIGSIRVLYMNKDKARDYGIDMPYGEVFEGVWTIDKLTEMTKDVYSDLNGNGEADAEDFYGFEYRDQYFICTLEPLGVRPYIRDDEEIIKLNLDNERTLTATDKMHALLFGSSGSFFSTDSAVGGLFADDRSLVTVSMISAAVNTLRFSDVNYSILPMPKLDLTQENYYAGYTSYLFAVPNMAGDLERTGTVIEALSAEGYKRVMPAYYEIALKNKYLQDDESVRILDLIEESKMLDFSWCYNVNYTGPYWFMRELFIGGQAPTTDFASWYGRNETRLQRQLENIIQKFEEMR